MHGVCMSKTTSHERRVAGLPLWAKRELEEQEAEIERLCLKLHEMHGRKPTPVSVPVPGEDPESEWGRRYLPEEGGVDFDLPNGVRINVSRDKNTVRVSEKTDTGQILVVPQTTGVINIGVLQQK